MRLARSEKNGEEIEGEERRKDSMRARKIYKKYSGRGRFAGMPLTSCARPSMISIAIASGMLAPHLRRMVEHFVFLP